MVLPRQKLKTQFHTCRILPAYGSVKTSCCWYNGSSVRRATVVFCFSTQCLPSIIYTFTYGAETTLWSLLQYYSMSVSTYLKYNVSLYNSINLSSFIKQYVFISLYTKVCIYLPLNNHMYKFLYIIVCNYLTLYHKLNYYINLSSFIKQYVFISLYIIVHNYLSLFI